MKKLYFTVIISFCFVFGTKAQETVTIPNGIFKTYLLNHTGINTNEDNEIQVSEATAFTGKIDVTNLGISNLTGIEAFTALTELNVSKNNLTSLNVTNNTALTYLRCDQNDLTSLDVTNNTALTFLRCDLNDLTSLDVSNNIVLIELLCNNNELSVLDVSNNTLLETLNTRSNNNLSSLNVNNNTALTHLDCSYNDLNSLDVSNNTNLTFLNCSFNYQITSLDVSNNTTLTFLSMAHNQITTLDVSNNTALKYLAFANNQITSIDVSHIAVLEQLSCANNLISGSFDVSVNPNLFVLTCQNNQLTSLNIANGNNTNFMTLNTTGNPDLECIQVDNEAYSNANWTAAPLRKDVASTFSEVCEAFLGTADFDLETVKIYPNPAIDFINITNTKEVKIFDLTGKLLINQNVENEILNVSSLSSGIYILKTSEGKKVKFVKE